jgi:uncharacterized protein YjiK
MPGRKKKYSWKKCAVVAVCSTTIAMLTFMTACEAQRRGGSKVEDIAGTPRVMKLRKELKEISGLASDAAGRVFAHDDERGVIYHLDPMTGSVLARFTLGRSTVNEDFEGLAIAGAYFYMVTSSGDIYQFREGSDGGRVEYRIHPTFLGKDNDVEGLCYDPATDALLLACKGSPGRGYSGRRAIYSFDLRAQRLERKPRILLDEKRLRERAGEKRVQPSGIERHPLNGHFFVLAAQGSSLIELSPEGRVLSQVHLPAERHPQPEGITFLPNGDLLISDEGKKHGSLTRYARGADAR